MFAVNSVLKVNGTPRAGSIGQLTTQANINPQFHVVPVPDRLLPFVQENKNNFRITADGNVVPNSNEVFFGILAKLIADKRWRHETNGVVIGGYRIPTDDRGKLLYNGAYNRCVAKVHKAIYNNVQNGGTIEEGITLGLNQVDTIAISDTVTLTATYSIFINIALGVGDFVQDCFTRWNQILNVVRANMNGGWEAMLDVYEAEINLGWPGSKELENVEYLFTHTPVVHVSPTPEPDPEPDPIVDDSPDTPEEDDSEEELPPVDDPEDVGDVEEPTDPEVP